MSNQMLSREMFTNQSLSEDFLAKLANQFDVPLVTVFCGSRTGDDDAYVQDGRALGAGLARHGMGLVYGGASIGVMGAVADGVMDSAGVAIGIIPDFLLQREVAHHRLSQLYITDSMHTRKTIMAHLASAFVVLAGGLGTLEEMLEIATWRQLAQHDKPIILVNTKGFYDHLINHIQHTERSGFMSVGDIDNIMICQTVDEALKLLSKIISA